MSDQRAIQSIYVVQWTEAGHFAPKHHAFWAPEPAADFEDILRTNGHHHVTTHQLDQEAP